MTTPQERLENYSRSRPREVLRLTVRDSEGEGEILVYKGFTSSLSRATAFDPDVPVLEPDTEILWVDRIQAPYQPQSIQYLEQHLSWVEFSQRLEQAGF
ncbi:hypothetical protein GlitD10_0416 [Gloeomargarita lithophora Alchichica-D10]|uniref:DUF7734 domain-containing protein n=1 Tax=Gloeomargarita lithophora Alchichica-D10 TaxID=1188229 RepID=A0A1J0A9X3_9CYAN|nr:hypothetical protein [Gloeomargarita lithophora]APB32727.1 hypothetical protein GlitD10_0416 [Gloeomargarita lithophora Alchichica-D10]